MSTAATRSRADVTASPLAWLLALTALGGILRFATVGVQSYWNDEAVTASLLHQGFADMVRALPGSESTPPLFYVLAWPWTRVFGLSEAGLRSFSALAGTLTIPVAWYIGERAASARAGLVAAALVAVNPLLWWYSQEGRAYALVVLLTAVATALFVDFIRGERRLWWWAVAAALALGTHYFAVFLIGPQAIWIGWRAWHARRPDLFAPLVLVGVTAAALLPLAIRQASNHGAQFIEHSGSLPFRMAQVPKQFLIGFDGPLEVVIGVVAAAAALTGVAFLVARTDAGERRGAILVAVPAVAAVLVPVAASLVGIDYLITRNLIPALVPLLVVLAIGFGARNAGAPGVLAGTVLCFVSLATVIGVSSDAAYQRDDWRGVADALGPAENDRVLVVTPADGAVALKWYLPGAQVSGGPVTTREIDSVGVGRRTAGQSPKPPRGPVSVPAGFTVTSQVKEPTFTVVTLRASQPQLVDYAFANERRLARDVSASVLHQPQARSLGPGD